MDISLFDYHLPRELIAQFPAEKRDESRLMILNRESGTIETKLFKSIVDYLQKGDALVINNTRVFKARLLGNRLSGGKVEIFLAKPLPSKPGKAKNGPRLWEAMAHPSRRLKENEEIQFGRKNSLVLEKDIGGGKWLVSFPSKEMQKRIVGKFGHMPLPHYIKRIDIKLDMSRYQTVFARKDKAEAVAAPTAGLHFTKALLAKIKKKGVKIIELTLDVGPGTFKPVKVENIDEHEIDPEQATLSAKAAATLNKIKKAGGRIIAVGTTSVRTLESAPIKSGQVQSFSGPIDLYIRPGHNFKAVDLLVTNFHLPRSSLLILVSAFAGREKVLKAYEQAVKKEFRFYSYGDAMLII
ncbi:MAG TPA: tRNA preQ1(34) S-adenosylmethionine ribosyltransferase-isomerase QueA [candidate division Zixibacteria bacterium]|nr:tRNA preQ1(34) S-adenosylmethionine ribosyltransferase-isomerase QueA [candidate division Zixibacteria bacterium]